MKKLIVLICLLAAVQAFGQATGFQREAVGTFTFTLDSTDAETLAVGFPANRGKALFMAWLEMDSLKATTVIDSVVIRYRPSWATFDTTGGVTRANAFNKAAGWADGAVIPWSYAQIYHGPSGSLLPFNVGYTAIVPFNRATPGGKIPLIFDMDGYPWRSMQILITTAGGKDVTSDLSNDSIKVVLTFDID